MLSALNKVNGSRSPISVFPTAPLRRLIDRKAQRGVTAAGSFLAKSGQILLVKLIEVKGLSIVTSGRLMGSNAQLCDDCYVADEHSNAEMESGLGASR